MAFTIQLKGQPIRKEGVASEIMSPGHFVVSDPSDKDNAGSLAFPAVAGGAAQGVVYENEIEGQTITDAYAANDNVLYGVFPKGSEVLGRVAAGAAAIAKGDPLIVQTDGTVITNGGNALTGAAETVLINHTVGIALEAVDNSGGGSEVFIKMEIV